MGKSSHYVVAVVRRITGIKKVGHTGTLDPLATGVLPICIGRQATKLSQMIMDGTKEYIAEVQLGKATTTQDSEGEIIEEMPAAHITQDQICDVLELFKGDIQQVPPMYSAIKVNGEKLYHLARKGIEVERKPRTIRIYNITFMHMDTDEKRFKIKVECSKGTYIRTLCADIGKALGTCAYMHSLIRSRCGAFLLENTVTLEDFENLWNKGEAEKILISPEVFLKETE